MSRTWEALIGDTKLEKYVEDLRTAKTKVIHLNNEMKKLPLAEKVAKET